MGRLGVAKTFLGALAIAGMLVLASPGVRAERAPGAQASGDTGGQCHAGRPSTAGTELEAFLADLRREQLARALERGGPPSLVVLNNRGYNYDPRPGDELDSVMAEAQRSTRP